MYPTIVDLHVILIREPCSAYCTPFLELFLEVLARWAVQNIGEHDLILEDLSKQWRLHVVVVGPGRGLTPSKLDMSLEFLPQAKLVATIDALGEAVLSMKKSVEALLLGFVVASAVHDCSVLPECENFL